MTAKSLFALATVSKRICVPKDRNVCLIFISAFFDEILKISLTSDWDFGLI